MIWEFICHYRGARRRWLHPMYLNTGPYPREIQSLRKTDSSSAPVPSPGAHAAQQKSHGCCPPLFWDQSAGLSSTRAQTTRDRVPEESHTAKILCDLDHKKCNCNLKKRLLHSSGENPDCGKERCKDTWDSSWRYRQQACLPPEPAWGLQSESNGKGKKPFSIGFSKGS